MTDWKIKYGDSPIYRLNTFITSKLDEMQFIDLDDYQTDLPGGELELPYMLPGQDLPEITTVYDQEQYVDLSYCVYNVTDRFNNDEPYMSCGQIAYNFYHTDIDYLLGMKDYLSELLRREDWTASDVNVFYATDETYAFDFKMINIMGTAGPAPTDDEGGRHTLLVIVRYDSIYEGLNRNEDPDDIHYSIEFGMR